MSSTTPPSVFGPKDTPRASRVCQSLLSLHYSLSFEITILQLVKGRGDFQPEPQKLRIKVHIPCSETILRYKNQRCSEDGGNGEIVL